MWNKIRVTVQKIDEETIIINLAGDITSTSEAMLKAAYQQASSETIRNIIFNFQPDYYFDSLGVTALISIVSEARKKNQHLSVALPNAHSQKIFQMVGLTCYTTVYSNLEEAMTGVKH